MSGFVEGAGDFSSAEIYSSKNEIVIFGQNQNGNKYKLLVGQWGSYHVKVAIFNAENSSFIRELFLNGIDFDLNNADMIKSKILNHFQFTELS